MHYFKQQPFSNLLASVFQLGGFLLPSKAGWVNVNVNVRRTFNVFDLRICESTFLVDEQRVKTMLLFVTITYFKLVFVISNVDY